MSYTQYFMTHLFQKLCCCFVNYCQQRGGRCKRRIKLAERVDAARIKLASEFDFAHIMQVLRMARLMAHLKLNRR